MLVLRHKHISAMRDILKIKKNLYLRKKNSFNGSDPSRMNDKIKSSLRFFFGNSGKFVNFFTR